MMADDPRPLPLERRRVGRPRVDMEPLERVSTRLPTPVYDRLVTIANERDTSVSMLVRQLLVIRLKP
jgi:hypothetical protein